MRVRQFARAVLWARVIECGPYFFCLVWWDVIRVCCAGGGLGVGVLGQWVI